MAKQQKSVFIRFNMDDENDRELYSRLTREAGNSASLTLYVKSRLIPGPCGRLVLSQHLYLPDHSVEVGDSRGVLFSQ